MSDLSDILKQFMEELAQEIRANVPQASGRTAEGIEVKVQNPGESIFLRVKGELWGPAYIQTLEDGRGPTKGGRRGSKTLQQSILEWLQIKNIMPRIIPYAVNQRRKATAAINPQVGLSWAIAAKIHKEGNRLFREGGKSGVLSTVITDGRLEAFVKTFNSKAGRIMLNQVAKTILS
jgi:hypothetical protein